MSGDVSVLSRFLVKFVEIVAAGLATAVSGYLIAHLSGALSSPVSVPARTVIEVTPNVGPPPQSPSTISGDPSEQHTTTKETASAAPQLARPVNTAKIALPRKHTETATNAAESKRDQESLVARVRDALANVDASRSGPSAVPAHREVRLEPAGPASQSLSSADSSHSAVTAAAPPGVGEFSPVLPPQPAPPNSLIAVEIQSRPVGAAQPSPTPAPETEPSIVSTLEQVLRHDPLAGSEQAPRPPMPVGQ
jgi:hypothetical protein